MGRRKIEIQPICEERNRTVTFIKRKAGLFKKAHELAVLCQVDVAVVILGSNNTFYEFSSVDMQEMIRYYQRDDLVHDVKGPSDFGDYGKKQRITLHEHTGKKQAARNVRSRADEDEENGDEEEDEDEDEDKRVIRNGSGGRITRNSLKREQQEPEGEPASKRVKNEVGLPPKFNPLQQMVQRQFQNLYHAASNSPNQSSSELSKPPTPPNRQNVSHSPKVPLGTAMATASATRVDSVKRPVLRVQIPSSNTLYNPGIRSGSSSASSVGGANASLISRNTSAVRYDLPTNPLSPRRQTPTAAGEAPDKSDPNKLTAKPLSGNSYGLPPMFSGSPAYPSYLATPLQGQANNGHSGNHPGPSFSVLKQMQMSHQHHTPQQPPQAPHPLTEPANGPLTGSLPSKFAHDLMVPSPSTSMSMFQDWTLGPASAKTGPNVPSSNQQVSETPAASYNNGSSGLTPYMMVNQTPLANRFFSFTADTTEDKNQEQGESTKTPKAS